MNKNIWVIANWKSNKNIAEALEWVAQVGPRLPKNEQLKVVVCSCFTALSEVKKAITVGNFPLMVGAQDLSPFGVGAYTGEEPAELLNQMVDLAILGHSERRENFGETDELIAKKTKAASLNHIIPLVCVQGSDAPVPDECKLVAYEPIFAIGTGNADTPENAEQVAKLLKEKNSSVEVLYGGSVTSQNVKSFIDKDNINGVLIGSASLDPLEFLRICQIVGE